MAKNETESKAEDEASRSFAVMLAQIGDGVLNADLSDEVRDLVAKMRDHATNTGGTAKGKVTVTVELRFKSGAFDVVADFKVTKPKPVREGSVFWPTDGNNLSRENMKQERLKFAVRKVDEAAEPRRDIR